MSKWWDESWNPVSGCTPCSPGCEHCYAERMAFRLGSMPNNNGYDPPPAHFKVKLHPERLLAPLRWRKPRRIFVCSMSDLFHPAVPDEFIDQVFTAMLLAGDRYDEDGCNVVRPAQTFIVLTKRAARMQEYISRQINDRNIWGDELVMGRLGFGEHCGMEQDFIGDQLGVLMGNEPIRLPDRIWLGVTAEDQQRADERIPLLLQTPAAVRFVSCEPLLGPVEFSDVMHRSDCVRALGKPAMKGIDWVIVGGETGAGARPMHPDWARSLRDQCQAAGVAFFFKQTGSASTEFPGWGHGEKLLDGVEHHEWPGEQQERPVTAALPETTALPGGTA